MASHVPRPQTDATAPERLMQGKRGLVMGVANDHSIAWGIARAVHAQGAGLAFTYQGEAFAKRVRPLAATLDATLVVPCDVAEPASLASVFETIGREWGGLDFLVHAVAYSDKDELKGRYVDTSLDNFRQTMDVSCYSFTEVARLAEGLMHKGGSLLTLTFDGSARVMPSYNVMGVAKAALEASVRYLAADLGGAGIRVNAISAGPMRTLAGSAVGDARYVYNYSRDTAPLQRNMSLEDIGGAALFLLSDLSAGVTGEIHYVDGGLNVVGIPKPRGGEPSG